MLISLLAHNYNDIFAVGVNPTITGSGLPSVVVFNFGLLNICRPPESKLLMGGNKRTKFLIN